MGLHVNFVLILVPLIKGKEEVACELIFVKEIT